jgi:hypothetical protein
MGLTRRRIPAAVLLLAVLVGLGVLGPRPAWADPPQHAQRHLTVATYNLYLGADLTPLFSAASPQELVQRAGQIYANVVKTDFPSRAEAIAKLLAANPPDVAGLQEVSLWETGPIGGPLSPRYDFLELLLAALARHGLTGGHERQLRQRSDPDQRHHRGASHRPGCDHRPHRPAQLAAKGE